MHSFEILDFCIGNQNHGRWEIILVQLGLLYPFDWCKYVDDLVGGDMARVNIFFDSVFNTEYVTDFLGFSMFEFVY